MDVHSFLEEIREIDPADIVFFVGSGFTRNLGYPSWDQLLLNMISFSKKYSSSLSSLMQERYDNNQKLLAADLFFESEIPSGETINFFRNQFDKKPELNRYHRLLASFPISAFVTTNYDHTLEQGAAGVKKTPEPFRGNNRFREFTSSVASLEYLE